jgi:hypothetical protein
LERWENATGSKKFKSIDHRTPANTATAVLRELFELLEDYAPSWYTEEIHTRAAAALGEFQAHSAVN